MSYPGFIVPVFFRISGKSSECGTHHARREIMKRQWVNGDKIGWIKASRLNRRFKILPRMMPIPVKILLVFFTASNDWNRGEIRSRRISKGNK